MGQSVNLVQLLLLVREARARRPPPAYYIIEVDGLDIHVPAVGHADTMPDFMRLVGAASVEDDADGFDVGQFMAWYEEPADKVVPAVQAAPAIDRPSDPPAVSAAIVPPTRPSHKRKKSSTDIRASKALKGLLASKASVSKGPASKPPKPPKPPKGSLSKPPKGSLSKPPKGSLSKPSKPTDQPVARPAERMAAMARMLCAPGVDVEPWSDVVAEFSAIVSVRKKRPDQVIQQVRDAVADTVAGIRRGEAVADLLDRLHRRHGEGRLLLLLVATSLDDPSRLWAQVDRALVGSGVSDTRAFKLN